jgi:hypothetical protein
MYMFLQEVWKLIFMSYKVCAVFLQSMYSIEYSWVIDWSTFDFDRLTGQFDGQSWESKQFLTLTVDLTFFQENPIIHSFLILANKLSLIKTNFQKNFYGLRKTTFDLKTKLVEEIIERINWRLGLTHTPLLK